MRLSSHLTHPVAGSLTLLLVACSSTSGGTDGGERDLGAVDHALADQLVGRDTVDRRCDPGQAALPLSTLPSKVVIGYPIAASCDPLRSTFLLRNTGAAPVDVVAVGISPAAAIFTSELGLPSTIGPDQSVPLPLRFKTDTLGDTAGELTVIGRDGCFRLPLRGVGVDAPVMVFEPLAVDFGAIPVNSTSKQVTITIGQTGGRTEFSVFRAVPADRFEIVSSPATPAELGACEQLTVKVVLRAPSAPAALEGQLLIESMSNGHKGLSSVPLIGRAVPKP